MSQFKKLQKLLKEKGLGICYAFSTEHLPASITGFFQDHQIDCTDKSLLFIGNEGDLFWDHFKTNISELESNENPLDEKVCAFIQDGLLQQDIKLEKRLYPNSKFIFPIQDLFAHFHLGTPSLLGISINRKNGLWWAARFVALIDHQEVEQGLTIKKAEEICLACEDKPCIDACPSVAISIKEYKYENCKEYRLQENSKCESTCLSRRACPIGESPQYQKSQEEYHMLRNLNVIKNL